MSAGSNKKAMILLIKLVNTYSVKHSVEYSLQIISEWFDISDLTLDISMPVVEPK